MRRIALIWGGLLILALTLPGVFARAENAVDPALAQKARTAAHKAADSLNLQTDLPADVAALARKGGSYSVDMPNMSSFPLFSANVASGILWAAVVAILIVVLMTIRDNVWSASQSRRLSRAEKEAVPAAVAARMDKAQLEAEELARRGDFAEAMHVLLLQSVGELRRLLHVAIAASLTSREILLRVSLPPEGRAGFAAIIGHVEVSYFGSHQPDESEYLACLRGFEALTRSLRQAAPEWENRP